MEDTMLSDATFYAGVGLPLILVGVHVLVALARREHIIPRKGRPASRSQYVGRYDKPAKDRE